MKLFTKPAAVVKLSGKAVGRIATDGQPLLTALRSRFPHMVIVHGGGQTITEWCRTFGIATPFIRGQRVTTPDVLNVVMAVQCGLVNVSLVNELLRLGIPAIGLTPSSCGLATALPADEGLGCVGTPMISNIPEWIVRLIGESIIPVCSTVCRDNSGQLRNVNADPFSAQLAMTMGAEELLFISDTPGISINGKIQAAIHVDDLRAGIASGDITDGMIPKIEACLQAASTSLLWIGSIDTAIRAFVHGDPNAGTRIVTPELVNV